MVFFSRNKKIKDSAHALFAKIVEQARQPKFYADWKVGDTLDGRFDLIILHVALVVNRLERADKNKKTALLIRYIQEVLFDNMDMSLREIGVGDMSVGKKVKIMAEAYYGRAAAYDKAIQSDDVAGALRSALVRNIYRGHEPEDIILNQMISYIIRQVKYLESRKDEDILLSDIIFEDVIEKI